MNGDRHILVVEDDFEDRFILDQSFKELGCGSTVDYIEDSTMVMSHLAAVKVDEISLIILDLNMPKLNGTETLRKIKSDAVYSRIPVIIFSTSLNEIEKERCMELGAMEYITKPSRYLEYIATCRRFCELSLA